MEKKTLQDAFFLRFFLFHDTIRKNDFTEKA